MKETKSKPWEIQPGETTSSYECWVHFRDSGPSRSHQKTSQHTNMPIATIQDYSRRYKWAIRVKAWIEELDRVARLSQISAIEEMNDRHATLAVQFLEKVTARLDTIDFSDLKGIELARVLEISVKVERLCRGQETDIVRQRFGQMTDDQLIDYLRNNMPVGQLPEAPLQLISGEDEAA